MPPPTTPDGPAPRSGYLLAPMAGFPISWEVATVKIYTNEAESSSLALRPASCLGFNNLDRFA